MTDYFSQELVETLKANEPVKARPAYDLLVRSIDVFASAVGLLMVSPILLAISLLIKLGDGGPVFFRQSRMGKGGTPFSILKFRTMVVNAEQKGDRWRMVKNDPRVTRIGKYLREYHLDELPQLFNVLWGDMSLVGPRPALLFQKDYYEKWELPRLQVSPGITGLSQVSGGNALNWDQRIIVDVYYVRNRSLGLYLSILVKTFLQLFIKKGIYTADGNVKGWTRPVPEWYQQGLTAPPADSAEKSAAQVEKQVPTAESVLCENTASEQQKKRAA